MEKTELAERIRKIIVSVVKHENFEMKDELTASDVDGWDSLSHMTIITEIEHEFNIKFRLKDLKKLTNAGSLIEVISTKIEEAQ